MLRMSKATGSKINDQTLTTLKLIGNKHTNSSDISGSLKVIGGGSFSENVLIQGNLYVHGSVFAQGTNATELQGEPISATTPVANDVLVYSGSDWRPRNTLNLAGDLTVGGNLLVTGTTTTINSVTVTTVDNVILINSGEVGAGVTSTYNSDGTLPGAGIEIDRGSLTNYQIVFDETTDSVKVGLKNSALATVLTTTSSLTTNGVLYWNSNYIINDPSMLYTTGLLYVPTVVTSDRIISKLVSSSDYLTLHSESGIKIGGSDNVVSNTHAIISGGNQNTASGQYSAVLGGRGNIASGNYSTVIGGNSDSAVGLYSLAAGRNNAATMNYTTALGNNANANTTGSFVYSDNSGRVTTPSDANQFVVRGSGGFLFFTGSAADTQGVKIRASDSTVLKMDDTFIDANARSINGYLVSTDIPTLGQGLIFNGTIWTPSDISGNGIATSIQGRLITSDTYNAALNNVLIFNGTQWGASDSVILKKGTFGSDLTSGVFNATKGTFSSDLTAGVFNATKGTFSSDLTSGVFNATKGTFSSDLNILSLIPSNTDQTTMVANGETITTTRYLNSIDAGTGARTGVILSAGTVDSQQLRIVNKGSYSISFAPEATSNVSGGTSISIDSFKVKDFSWRSAISRWVPNSGGGNVTTFANGSAGNLSNTNSDQETTPIISNIALSSGTLAGLSAKYLSPITSGSLIVKTSINNSDRHIITLNTSNQTMLTMSDIPFYPSDLISVRIDTIGLAPIGPQEHVCVSVYQRT